MRRRGAEFGRLDAGLLADPLAFLSAEHARQRALLRHLERIARMPGMPGAGAIARGLLCWLAEDLPGHLDIEARALHARLAPAAQAGLMSRLDTLRTAVRDGAARCLAQLRPVASHRAPPSGFAATVWGFGEALRGFLAMEEEEILPLARRSLDARSLAQIAAEMARRGSA